MYVYVRTNAAVRLITFAGVLLMQINTSLSIARYTRRPVLEVEIHVRPQFESVDRLECGGNARVTHVVVRLDTVRWSIEEPTFANRIAMIEGPLMALPYLQLVTLETTDRKEGTELIRELPLLHTSQKLSRRTCREAQEIAQEAEYFPPDYAGEHGVVSPLWYSDAHSYYRDEWCVVVV